MDFKVAGSANGITALQMDIKIEGITEEIMEVALNQAFAGRMHILNEMNKVISRARPEISNACPTLKISINPDKIRDVIGKGGATIRAITEETKAAIDIEDNGTVRVFGRNEKLNKRAVLRLQKSNLHRLLKLSQVQSIQVKDSYLNLVHSCGKIPQHLARYGRFASHFANLK